MKSLVTCQGRKRTKRAVSSFDPSTLRTLKWLRDVVSIPSLPSTNDLALKLARNSSQDVPLLVLTDRQTAGRGRGDHQWWAAPGALTFSLVIDAVAEGLQGPQWPQISLTTAVAVMEILNEIAPDRSVGLRWPNDVYVEGRKICGVLVEPVNVPTPSERTPGEPPGLSRRPANVAAAYRRDKPGCSPKDFQPGGSRDSSACRDRVVVGVGLNVNNSLADAPDDVRTVGTSLVDLTSAQVDLNEMLPRLLDHITDRLRWLATEDSRLPAAWQKNCLLRGRTVTIHLGPRVVEGRCHGINRGGALRIETGPDRIEVLYGGVISEVQ